MPYHKPLREKGIREPQYWHFIKLCWFMVHFDDLDEEISVRKFCKNFFDLVISKGIIEKIEAEYNLEWEYYNEDGSHTIPDYDKLMSGGSKPKKYKWKEHYPIFETDRLQAIPGTERAKFIKNIPKLAKGCRTTIQHCESREEHFNQLESQGMSMDYPRNKNTDTKRNEIEMWKDIVGLEDSVDDQQEAAPGIHKIIENPPWENKEELAEKRKILWGIMPKRGETE